MDETPSLLGLLISAHRLPNISTTMEISGRLGADVNEPTNDGTTPIYIAAYNGHAAVVEILGRLGAYFNKPDNDGTTPTHIAAYDDHAGTVTWPSEQLFIWCSSIVIRCIDI